MNQINHKLDNTSHTNNRNANITSLRSLLRSFKLVDLLSLSIGSLILAIPNFAIASPNQAQLSSTLKALDQTSSAQAFPSNTKINTKLNLKISPGKINPIMFKPRPSQGKPLEALGAGTRSNDRCVADRSNQPNQSEAPDLTLVVPTLSENITVSDRPTFWFYLPKTTAKTIEFSLFEKTPNALGEYKTGIYQVSLPIERQSIVTGYRLPANAPALAVGKKYEWAIALVCDPNNRQRDLNASSTISRIDLTAEQQSGLSQASALQKSEFFANNGIWSDMVTALSTSDRLVVNQLWQDLLKSESVQLGKIAEQPLQP
jgi:hypothetical protein